MASNKQETGIKPLRKEYLIAKALWHCINEAPRFSKEEITSKDIEEMKKIFEQDYGDLAPAFMSMKDLLKRMAPV